MITGSRVIPSRVRLTMIIGMTTRCSATSSTKSFLKRRTGKSRAPFGGKNYELGSAIYPLFYIGGTYVLYNTVVATFFASQGFPILWDVFSITCLLAGVTVLSRMRRLDKIQWSSSIGALAFALGIIGYLTSVSCAAKQLLSSALLMPIPDVIIWWFLASGLVSAGLSKWKPRWGMFPLIGLGGVAVGFVLVKLFQQRPNKLGPSFWALFLANAAFLYLWWLAGSLFDLVYIWHRFICTFKTTSVLSKLRHEAQKQLQA